MQNSTKFYKILQVNIANLPRNDSKNNKYSLTCGRKFAIDQEIKVVAN